MVDAQMSPSSRRAWIEIGVRDRGRLSDRVALLAEGVDRNLAIRQPQRILKGRPPRGGRG